MSEVILQLEDTVSFDHIVALLAPYIKNAEIKQAFCESGHKIWDGNMACLQNPWKIESFSPIKRDNLYDR
jgi:hypothetical protein